MFLKDDRAVLDYVMDWTEACADGRTIVDSRWSVEPSGLELLPLATEARRAVVQISGGLAGSIYRVSNVVGFSDGMADARALVVRVEKR